MATGPATTQLLEVNWSSTTYTDLSSRVVTYSPVTIRQGRGSRFDDVQPGTMTVVLDNSDGALTPDNPLSAYYPNVVENKAIRWAITPPGGASTRRFWGRIVSIEPDSPSGIMAWSRVRLTCVDRLGILTRKVLRCDYVERALYYRALSLVDIFPFTSVKQRPTTLANKGDGGGTAEVYPPIQRRGDALSVQDPDGIMLDGAVEVRGGTGIGPVIHVDLEMTPTGFIIPFRTGDRVPAGGADKYVAQGVSATGQELWSLRLVDNAGQTDLNFYDATTLLDTMIAEFAPAGDGEPGDDQWHALWFYTDPGGDKVFLIRQRDDEVVDSHTITTFDLTDTRGIVLGGRSNRRTRGKQTRCVSATYGAVAAYDYVGLGEPVGTFYLQPDGIVSVSTRLADLEKYADVLFTETGAANRDVWLKRTTGRTPFDVLSEVARTTGSMVRADYNSADDEYVEFIHASALRSSTVAVTIDAEADLDASADFPWRRGIDTRPNEVTATWPGGESTVTMSQALGVLEDSVDTCAANRAEARSVASARMRVGKGLAPTSLAVDLVNAQNDLWSDVFALKVGDRIRVTSLPSTYYGRTYTDLYVLGWTEEHDQAGSRFVFEVEPADDASPKGIVGTSRVSREIDAQTVTSGTAVGTDTTGTIVVTTASGAPLTNDASDYPMDLDWNGERVTVTSAPAASSSPQTLTITARGVAPTVARSHSADEAIRPWQRAMVTF